MANQSPVPPVAAHATRVYGQYFDGFNTEDEIKQAMIDLHGASVIEKSYMQMHLQYLNVVQAGRSEMMLATLLAELRAFRQQAGPIAQQLEELTVMGADAATAAVQLAEMGLAAPELPEGFHEPVPLAAPELPEGFHEPVPPDAPTAHATADGSALPALPPGVEPFNGFEPDEPIPDPADGDSVLPARARPMAPAPSPEPTA